jgi:dephospho-CoA kinase
VFYSEGALNRSQLAQVVFISSKDREKLESILHPPITAVITANVAAARQHSQNLVIAAPLLIEAGLQDMVEHLWVVSCSSALQLKRLCQRGGLDEAEARKWIDAQMPLQQKEQRADTVLVNNGTIHDFQQLVEQEWNRLVAKA